MGSASGSGEQELDGHIQVACTAHASTGVRRLVKSVIRGIKVREYNKFALHRHLNSQQCRDSGSSWYSFRASLLCLCSCGQAPRVCSAGPCRAACILPGQQQMATPPHSLTNPWCCPQARQDPEAAREGMGGTYFFTNEAGRKVAIFKPCDEEPLAPANPKGYVGRNLGDPGWKSTVRVGEAAMREVAAYLLDHDHYAQVRRALCLVGLECGNGWTCWCRAVVAVAANGSSLSQAARRMHDSLLNACAADGLCHCVAWLCRCRTQCWCVPGTQPSTTNMRPSQAQVAAVGPAT